MKNLSLSAHGLRTGLSLQVKSGGETTYLQGIHAILDVHENVGIGKRNMPSRRIATYNNFITSLWKHSLKNLAKVIIGEAPGDDDPPPPAIEIDLESIPEPNPRYDLTKIGMLNEPQTEQDVIFAFGHYLGTLDEAKLPFRQHNQSAQIDAAAQIPVDNEQADLQSELSI